MKKIAQFLLRISGWRCISPPAVVTQSVICVAPHTSNWDFIIGSLYARCIGQKASFMMKKEWFFFPLGAFFRQLGGVAIDRVKKASVVENIVSCFTKGKRFTIAITPEGTRKAVASWKTGFYRIATQAGVPIQLARIDFQKKVVGIFEIFYPTGNEEEDLKYIRSRYKKEQAKYPEQFIEYTEA